MKKIILPILLLISFLQLSCNQTSADTKKPLSDTEEKESRANNLKDWTYHITYDVEKTTDSIQPIAEIEFKRTKVIEDKKRESIHIKEWLPSMEFNIYKIQDLQFCKQKSDFAKRASSCSSPNQGGDLIVVQNFVLLNYSVCTNCISFDDEMDYCRPFIKEILSDLNLNNSSTLKDLKKAIDKKIK
ncbi:hypothetical protein [Kordia sp.]|uniref:hypothetical protein n=1 Tax=Kordia sp. TaxID=1965332 RepID=UPI003D6BEB91